MSIIAIGNDRVHFSENTKTCPGKSISEIYNHQSVINNYAKSKGVNVRFFDPRELLEGDEFVSPVIEDRMANSVGVEVTKKRLFKPDIKKTGWVKYFGRKNEKPFIRAMYEQIQSMCGDKSPIVQHKADTINRLIKAGKIVK